MAARACDTKLQPKGWLVASICIRAAGGNLFAFVVLSCRSITFNQFRQFFVLLPQTDMVVEYW